MNTRAHLLWAFFLRAATRSKFLQHLRIMFFSLRPTRNRYRRWISPDTLPLIPAFISTIANQAANYAKQPAENSRVFRENSCLLAEVDLMKIEKCFEDILVLKLIKATARRFAKLELSTHCYLECMFLYI